ncbi:biotin-protein ligase [Nannizzia gypsea CBS 118893]|uniref:Biotin-protein ligase n=1 Tax=Arthroderma gypseum (strain ATCC MYA-4604 / CBS 118893) TaxID=535722 RepID=E4V541_ARTGP|nr:biotin-protein ligase [Nannizzia gypsea CBS 118893]EFR05115.1 biotin-protein ligase [Nannizzia gypsea CBS 118893]
MASGASKRLNVLVYSGAQTYPDWRENILTAPPGNGTTVDSVRQCLYTLRRILSPNYAVIPVTGEMVIKEPWTASCALFVMPGGADLPYCRTLNGEGNRRIKQFVQRGGSYLGLCAGGYYGSARCEFEVGNKKLEVIGDRELAFFPGIARGCAFAGFVYHSEEGARAADLKVSRSALPVGSVPDTFKCYYNGGGVFVDASKYADEGIEVLASYTEKLHVDPGEGQAAVVYCPVGDGAAILTGPHPEFSAANLDRDEASAPDYSSVVDVLARDDKVRTDFLKACLAKLGLQINQDTTTVPSLSQIHLSALEPGAALEVLSSLEDVITTEDGEDYVKDDNDTFILEKPSSMKMAKVAEALPEVTPSTKTEAAATDVEDRIVDYNAVVKRLVINDELPDTKTTPYFNHHAFYSNLKEYRLRSKEDSRVFGSHMLYGEVVTSTNTILEKNSRLLRRLPNGTTATATVQVAGRGRGSNVWVSPPGQLMFSVCVHHPVDKLMLSPVVFIQYLVAMAIVQGVKSYGKGYETLPVKLKWPNDIYALDPSDPTCKTYTKIGGILVNAHYSANEYIAVVGAGLNALNPAPTTSLNALLQCFKSTSNPEPPSLEKLLARILTTFEELYGRFLRTGFDKEFEDMYYSNWLHMDQIVTLEAEGGVRARVKGITRDYGLLIAEELGWEDRPTGKVWQLQSDSNSFDFFKGLLKRKM